MGFFFSLFFIITFFRLYKKENQNESDSSYVEKYIFLTILYRKCKKTVFGYKKGSKSKSPDPNYILNGCKRTPLRGSRPTTFFGFCSTLTASHNGVLESFSDDGQFTYHVMVVEIQYTIITKLFQKWDLKKLL